MDQAACALGPGYTMVDIRTRDVFATMRPELLLVQSRLEEAARIDFPGVADLIIDLLRAGGKRLRPLVLLLAGRAYAYDRETLVTAGAGVERDDHRRPEPVGPATASSLQAPLSFSAISSLPSRPCLRLPRTALEWSAFSHPR